MMSLRRRLALTHALVLGLALLFAGLLLHDTAEHQLERDFDAGLVAIASAQAASATDAPGPHVHPTDPSVRVGLYDAAGRSLPENSPGLPEQIKPARHAKFKDVETADGEWRAYLQPVTVRDQTYTLLVARSTATIEAAEQELWWQLGVWLVPGLIVAAASGAWLAGRALAPLRHLAAEATAMGPNAIDRRLQIPQTHDEMAGIATAFNHVLTRLEQAFQAQERFIHDAAHEVRTPLAALRASLEVALRRRRDPEAYETVIQDALIETQRLGQLVDQLLLLGKTGMALSLAPIDLHRHLEETLRLFSALAETRGLTLSLAGEATTLGDADRLDQVWSNLLSNAVRHSPDGGTIRVRLSTEGDRAFVRVQDQGSGIPPGKEAVIFERFSRLDESRNRDEGGAGLGLAISRAIVEAHGGTIRVEQEGPGATFCVALPRAAERNHS